MPYPARPIVLDARDYASHKSLLRMTAFDRGAGLEARQAAIEYVVKAHGFSKDDTKTLVYDAALNQPGRNIAGNIRIGPPAFEQDLPWLAGVVFHELVHSPQYVYYAGKGITGIDPKRSETERRMVALDEYEAYWWTLLRRKELALSPSQQAEINKRAQFALIDLDEATAQKLAQNQKFDGARDELIRQFNAAPAAAARGTVSRNTSAACCT